MAEMSELSKLAVDYLFGDRTVFANDEELNAVVCQLSDQLRPEASGTAKASEVTGFRAEAADLPAARREAARIAALIADGKTKED